MKRGGFLGGLLGRLGQSQTSRDNKETQIKIPNLATLWRILWMCAGWAVVFSLILPFGVQWLWERFDAARDAWWMPYAAYSKWWTMPTFFEILLPVWRLFPVLVGFEVLDATFGIRKHYKREVKHPGYPGPLKAIHPMEYTEKPGQMPNQLEADLYADHEVPDASPPPEIVTVTFKKGRKIITVDVPKDFNSRTFLIGAMNDAKPFSQKGSGFGRARWEKLRDKFIKAGWAKWKNIIFHKQGCMLTEEGKQAIRGAFPLP